MGRTRWKLLVVVFTVVSVVAVAPPLMAQAQDAIVTETVAGTNLSLQIATPYARAVLTVSGPENYGLHGVFGEGDLVTVDLLSANVPEQDPDTEGVPQTFADVGAPLPDGRYHYEVKLYDADGRLASVGSGVFFLEGGTTVSRLAKRSELSGLRRELQQERKSQTDAAAIRAYNADDELNVLDTQDDQKTHITIQNGTFGYYEGWQLYNDYGDLKFDEDTSSDPPGTTRVFFERGGDVGIGTSAPTEHLHLSDTDPSIFLEDPAGTSVTFDTNFGDDFNIDLVNLDGGTDDIFNVLTLEDDSSSTFCAGCVGINAGNPEAPLEVRGPTSGPSAGTVAKILVEETASTVAVRELFELRNNGGPFFIFRDTDSSTSFSFAMASVGDFIISHQQTPGVQFRLQPDGDLIIAGSLTQGSSRASKERITPVDAATTLERVLELPIKEWSYKADNESARHVGPMAEDFREAFGLGSSPESISALDTSGVALASIQALHAELAEQRAANQAKERRIAALEERLEQLEAAIRAMAAEQRPQQR